MDRWLFHARVFKTRSFAADRIATGGVRLNGQPCRKPGQNVRPGDVVTAATPGGVRVLRVLSPGERRGPAAEARGLYDDLLEGARDDQPQGDTAAADGPEARRRDAPSGDA
nr:RNA-binding S4 domain-containing protein [Paracoccus sp. Z118]